MTMSDVLDRLEWLARQAGDASLPAEVAYLRSSLPGGFEARPVRWRKCPMCGREFCGKRADAVACSNKCRAANRRARLKEANP